MRQPLLLGPIEFICSINTLVPVWDKQLRVIEDTRPRKLIRLTRSPKPHWGSYYIKGLGTYIMLNSTKDMLRQAGYKIKPKIMEK